MKQTVIKTLLVMAVGFHSYAAAGFDGSVTHPIEPMQATTVNPVNILDPIPSVILTPVKDGVDLTVGSLQTVFDANFCQLNRAKEVTLATSQCQANIHYINTFLSNTFGTKALSLSYTAPLLNNALNIANIHYQKIIFKTKVNLPNGAIVFDHLSGGLLMPKIPGSQVKGVILYFSGTALNKADVGSNINAPNTQLIAAVFASQGYIVVMPDLIGLGDDWRNVHPYVLYPEVNAQTGVDMLLAVQPILQQQYQLPAKIKLFSIGMSEGGAYALWFSTYLTQKYNGTLNAFYQLTHAVGLSGAYNISTIVYNFLVNDVNQDPNTYQIQNQSLVNMFKPLLFADAFLAYATYSLNANNHAVFNDGFFNMNCTGYVNVLGVTLPIPQEKCDTNGISMNLKEAFLQPNYSPASSIIFSSLNKSTTDSSSAETTASNFGDLLVSTRNSILPLLSSATFADLNHNALLKHTLEAANVDLSILGDKTKVSIVSLQHDSVVTYNNFSYLVSTYPTQLQHALSIDETELQVVSPFSYLFPDATEGLPLYVPVDHTQFLIYGLVFALGILETF